MSSGCRAFFGGAAGIRTSGFPGQGLVGQSRRKLCLFGNHDAAGWREAFSFPAQYELCHFRRSSCLASFAVSRTRLNISIARIAPFDRQNSRMGSTSSLFPKNTTGGQTNPPSRLQTCLIQSQMLNLTALGTDPIFCQGKKDQARIAITHRAVRWSMPQSSTPAGPRGAARRRGQASQCAAIWLRPAPGRHWRVNPAD